MTSLSTSALSAELTLFRREAAASTLWLVGGYWTGVFIVNSIWVALLGHDPFADIGQRFVTTLFGAILGTGFALVLGRARALPFLLQIVIALILSLGGAMIYKLFSGEIYYGMWAAPTDADARAAYAQSLFYWTATFFGWCMAVVSLLFNLRVKEREQRLSQLRMEAFDAQMRALRYQINPHFLFNTLNSVCGLIEAGGKGAAISMVNSLSDFMRQTLDLDPLADTTLHDEFAVQRRYLSIESQRFSDRMTCAFDLPESISDLLVPNLILQPVVENAVKHGVARVTGPVHIRVEARRHNDRLIMTVENDCHDAEVVSGRDGIGLLNIRQRLDARFGTEAELLTQMPTPKLWRTTISMPAVSK